MALWRPDPTFYPSPKMAMQAPAEKLAFVAMLNANNNGKPDALAVVDVEPESLGYGHIVGQVDMPHPGDELHHFGWNACSACLCPYAPHPHVERRYLVVPGSRFSMRPLRLASRGPRSIRRRVLSAGLAWLDCCPVNVVGVARLPLVLQRFTYHPGPDSRFKPARHSD